LHEEKVETSFVKRDASRPTGFLLKSKVTSGDPAVEYYRKQSAASTMCIKDFENVGIPQAKHLHMTGISPALSPEVREFGEYLQLKYKKAGTTISFDPNLRPVLWQSEEQMISCMNEFAFRSDWFFPGIVEGTILTGYSQKEDIADFYHEKGVRLVVVKLGEAGAYYSAVNERGIAAGFKVPEVIDTVGAGDGFAAGVISGLLDSLSLKDAVMRGNAIGAMAVMSSGDMDGLPTRNELADFIQNQQAERGLF
jgi:2-dehydro-3-deoxygluconokinase